MVFVLLCIISIYSSMVIGQQNQLAHQVVDAINCGGQEYIDTLGIRYRSDPLDIGMNMGIRRAPQRDWLLYQTERYHYDTFSYDIKISKVNADYVLVLKFAEVYFASANSKVFDVHLNDHPILQELDIFAASGGRGVALDRAIPFSIVDGNLIVDDVRIKFNGVIRITFVKLNYDNPKCNAIYIIRATRNDIPMLIAANQRDYLDDDDDDIIDNDNDNEEIDVDSSWRQRERLIASGPRAPNPYGDDNSYITISALFTVVCVVPLFYCIRKLLR